MMDLLIKISVANRGLEAASLHVLPTLWFRNTCATMQIYIIYGGSEKFQTDPYWKDLVLFYEYFHGDNGAGIGASHQTGWTGCIARIIQGMGDITKEVLTGADAEMAAIKKTVGK